MSLFPPQRQLRSGSRCTTPHPWLVRCWHTGLGAQKEPSGMIASATPRRWLLNHQHTPNSKQFKTAAYSKCCSKLKLWFIDHHFTLPSDPRRCTIRSGDENSWIWVNVQIEHSDLSGPPWLSLCRGHAYPHPIFPSRQKKQQQPNNKNWKTYSGRISKQHKLSRFVKTRRLHHYPHCIPIDPPVLLYPQSLANIPLCLLNIGCFQGIWPRTLHCAIWSKLMRLSWPNRGTGFLGPQLGSMSYDDTINQ